MESFGLFVPLALLYGYLLVASWQPDTLSLMMPGDLNQGLKGSCSAPHNKNTSACFQLVSNWMFCSSLCGHSGRPVLTSGVMLICMIGECLAEQKS